MLSYYTMPRSSVIFSQQLVAMEASGKNVTLLPLPRDLHKKRFSKEKRKMRMRRCLSDPLHFPFNPDEPESPQGASQSFDRWGNSAKTKKQAPQLPSHDPSVPLTPTAVTAGTVAAGSVRRRPGFDEAASRKSKDQSIRPPRRQMSFDKHQRNGEKTGEEGGRAENSSSATLHASLTANTRTLANADSTKPRRAPVLRSQSYIDNIAELLDAAELELEDTDISDASSSSVFQDSP